MNERRDLLSVAEAASLLQVHPSRVRAMAQAQQLDAEKIGGRWLIYRPSIELRRDSEVGDGRPYSPANAWALLCLAEGEHVDWVSSSVQWRLRRNLRSEGLRALAPRLRSRADVMKLSGHPSALPRIASEPEVVESGANAAKQYGIDIQPSEELEVYVPRERVDDVVAKYYLEPSAHPNVVLRVVPDDPRFDWRACIGGAVVALDLLECQDPRSRRAAREFLASSYEAARQA